jgi:hypothetical protein
VLPVGNRESSQQNQRATLRLGRGWPVDPMLAPSSNGGSAVLVGVVNAPCGSSCARVLVLLLVPSGDCPGYPHHGVRSAL